MAEVDYKTACGDLARSWLQMLASTIVGYHDIAGLLHYRINAIGHVGACLELTDFLDCDTSHIDPERQLVENLFTVDDCSFLALKAFTSSSGVNVYNECGEVPQTFIQMLARCIVTHADLNWLNLLYDSDACTDITPLLTCVTNAIESERLLVKNAFGLDDCDRLGIKFFVNSSAFTDYNTQCTEAPESFYELLAQCLVTYAGTVWINIVAAGAACDELHAFWTCNNGHIEPERAIAENFFAKDACGNMALKWFTNTGERKEGQ